MTTTPAPTKQRFYWRAFVTFYIVLSFLVLGTSGLVLFVAPPGRIANWSYWSLGALSKAQWQAVHTIFSFLFVAAGAVHIYFNWRVILGYIRSRLGEGMKRRNELLAASGVGLAIVAATVTGLPPFSTVVDFGEDAKNSWATPQTEPPVPHAEAWTVAKFSETTKVPVEQAVANLEQAGIAVADAQKTTLLDLSRAHDMTPQQVYLKAVGQAKAAKTPLAEGGGYGRKTVQQNLRPAADAGGTGPRASPRPGHRGGARRQHARGGAAPRQDTHRSYEGDSGVGRPNVQGRGSSTRDSVTKRSTLDP